ncbi:MAG: GNAT family N-acetyltransferase [bacterium]
MSRFGFPSREWPTHFDAASNAEAAVHTDQRAASPSPMGPALETPRLSLREMSMADLDFVAEMLADPEVMRFYPKPYTRDESVTWIERQLGRYSRDGHGLWLVASRETGAPVGQVGLAMQEVDGVREPEIGYLVHRPFWRRGFASEAAKAVRDHAFGALGMPRVISLIRPVNAPSAGVARKIGMTPGRLTTFAGLEHRVFAALRAIPLG